MTKRFDVAAFGELVVDLIPVASGSGNLLFKALPGGAPGNVAAGVARLGQRAAMLSKVGPGITRFPAD
jgi:fructokinase